MRYGIGVAALAAMLALGGCQTMDLAGGGGLFGNRRPPDGPETLDAGAMWQVRGKVEQELPNRGSGADFATPVVHRDGRVRTVCGYVTPLGGRPVPYVGAFAGRGFLLITVGTTDVAAGNVLKSCAQRGAALAMAPAPAAAGDVPLPRRRG